MVVILTKTIYVAAFPMYINDLKDVISERFPESDFTISLERGPRDGAAFYHVEGTLEENGERNVFAFTLQSLYLLNRRQIASLTYTNAIFTTSTGGNSDSHYEGRTSLALIALIVKLCFGEVFVTNTKRM